MPTAFEEIARQIAEGKSKTPETYFTRGPVQRGYLGYSGWDPITGQGNFGTQFTGEPLGPAGQAPYSRWSPTPRALPAAAPRVLDPALAGATQGTLPFGASPEAVYGTKGFRPDRTSTAFGDRLGNALRASNPRLAGQAAAGSRSVLGGALRNLTERAVVRNAEGGINKLGTLRKGGGNAFKWGIPTMLAGEALAGGTGARARTQRGTGSVLDQALSGAADTAMLGTPFGPYGIAVTAPAGAIANPIGSRLSEALYGRPGNIANVLAKIPVLGGYLAPDAAMAAGQVEMANQVAADAEAKGLTPLQADVAATYTKQYGRAPTDEQLANNMRHFAERYEDPAYLEGIELLDPTAAAGQAQVAAGFGLSPEDANQRAGVFEQLSALGLAPARAFQVAYTGTPIYDQVMGTVEGKTPTREQADQFIRPYIDRMYAAAGEMPGSLGPSTRAIADAYGAAMQMGVPQMQQNLLDQAFVDPASYLNYTLGLANQEQIDPAMLDALLGGEEKR